METVKSVPIWLVDTEQNKNYASSHWENKNLGENLVTIFNINGVENEESEKILEILDTVAQHHPSYKIEVFGKVLDAGLLDKIIRRGWKTKSIAEGEFFIEQ